ncbi:MAG: right-handed parallel beta-helix repeat-containing protein, partial [Pirellulales bacterium]|nr:right-handed parallel beta-helix repeat-containing protein [Pirellulales bacterium]
IKVHRAVSCLLRRNLVTDSIDATGIWLDYGNRNSRVTQNVVLHIDCTHGGIFMEASQAPNMVDTNIVWATRGNGIYQHDCDELIIAHNFVGQSTQNALLMRVCKDRIVLGRPTTAKRNKILNNIFLGDAMLSISDPDNMSDHNVFVTPNRPFDLAAWRAKHGWDRNSVAATVRATFNTKTLEFTWSAAEPIPECPAVDGITHDFFDRLRQAGTVMPGPFSSVPREPTRVELRAQFARDSHE